MKLKRYEDEKRDRNRLLRLDLIWVIAVLALFLFIILAGLLGP